MQTSQKVGSLCYRRRSAYGSSDWSCPRASWGNERPFHVTNGKLLRALVIIFEPAGWAWADDDSGRLRVGSCMSRLCLSGATRPDGVKWIAFIAVLRPFLAVCRRTDSALVRKPQFGRVWGRESAAQLLRECNWTHWRANPITRVLFLQPPRRAQTRTERRGAKRLYVVTEEPSEIPLSYPVCLCFAE